MRAIVDHDRCNGHGRCYAVAPELFDVDDDGNSVVVEISVSPEQADAAQEAAGACPSRAIRLVD